MAKEPLYKIVERDLLERIATGVYPAGSNMPTENELCQEYGVSRITLRRAVEGLVERRLVKRVPRRGTTVCGPEELVKSISLTGYIDDVIPLNRHRVIDDSMRIPPSAIRKILQTQEGKTVRCIRSVNYSGGVPLSYTHFYFPAATAGLIEPADFSSATPPVRLIESRSGKVLAHAHQIVDPVTADDEVAEFLKIEPGRPVLRAIRGYFSSEQQPLEAIWVHYHPEKYRYEVTLIPKVLPLHRGHSTS